ncbi:hypothetical protein [Paractinoplanes brasiliensis]|uniref:DUF2550 family protein n=1 Tax=Paractinoplanes brasiliensis TaxID=52695 RepID=A0A4R6J7J9_9ACTN|nr:hypothetical protein [Actinoplanes brasiliensis]TDO31489.1 hypothetical protein C8E87_6913 [Actinoplanes brasiliensis]GID30885.1 hypothetical protein Abr02nite_58680 [Actinoplanes brasiliensis]
MRAFAGLVMVLLILAVIREVRARRRFAAAGSAFRCRFRRVYGTAPDSWRGLRRRWTRHMWARWTGDMLVVRRGPLRDRTIRVSPRVSPVGVYVRPRSDDLSVRLNVEGAVVEMTAAAENRLDLVGPFLAAAVSDLPKPPAGLYPL